MAKVPIFIWSRKAADLRQMLLAEKMAVTRCEVPFMPYLSFPPSAWVLPLKFDGGGYRAGGKDV
jgi:hypothetical protein